MIERIGRRAFLRRSTASLGAGYFWLGAGLDGKAALARQEWQHYGGDPGGMRYSPLDQINRSNVDKLRVAWTYHTGDARKRPQTTIECTPIVVDGVMYLTTAQLKVCALNAATGALMWCFDPFAELFKSHGRRPRGVSRGVAGYWQNGREKRILATALSSLFCLDARTGKLIPSFGKNGAVDLTRGLGRDISGLQYDVTSPGAIYKDLIVLGSEVGEGPDPAAPGHVRAFDIRSGRQVWIFHTIPQPGEFAHDTWPGDSWKTVGGANDWGGLTLDEKRGWVYLATGSASFDFYGRQRPGQNLFANCVVALEAATGKRVWHQQIVHHDLWDRDLPCQPSLVTVRRGSRKIDAVAQATKAGELFLFDRDTGAPLLSIEEQSVPASAMPGDKASPTQPQGLAYTRQVFTENDVTNISPEAHAYALQVFKHLRHGNEWLPVSLQSTLVFPGSIGGTCWGGGCFDPATGWFYVNSLDLPCIFKLKPAPPDAGFPYELAPPTYERFFDQEGYPAIKPPWGQLTAIDLNRGRIAWQVVLGERKELTARGIPQTGTPNIGGSLVTAGGLVFIGATQDEEFRAFDKSTGKVLWQAQLPAGGYASPCTYQANGKQYVVIAAGGGGKPETKSGDAFVAFALP
ncbi:MAG TPA: pyrroloquinoline quinone-dependent dehydrogenase [Terriglobia bacterium]|nr:pyrroloquinoline quinone-dependent dehydrogenase [Terriglobia bacterium]